MARFCSTTKAARQKYGAGLRQAGADLFALSMDRGRLGERCHAHPSSGAAPAQGRARGDAAPAAEEAAHSCPAPR